MSQRSRIARGARGGKLRLPGDVLDAVLSFSDLRTLPAAAASSEFRDGFARCCPALARKLVLRRFPILASVAGNDRSPRELFLSGVRIFPETLPRRPPMDVPTTALTDYAFSLEIELRRRVILATNGKGRKRTGPDRRETVYVGSANAILQDGAMFTIPAGIFERCYPERGGETPGAYVLKPYMRVMASRRTASRGLEFARLGQGGWSDYWRQGDDESFVVFGDLGALDEERKIDVVEKKMGSLDMFLLPELQALWTLRGADSNPAPASEVRVSFTWMTPHVVNDMTRDDILLALEHLVAWA
mmetsp:Transcript_11125/g.33186  ORF Transcript_11125/g.33186 Transcript_11125/m.33186 type:complete len:302 (-) Transcript_11125:24-929(-)|eukprot:CAMPEP_0119288814 /NCGR_PEP_ID=MMETSP1329-20130426/37914_1 /TAXON_ID=114041 /ORGANISM="Genus nov. species nov., Strain RCC1024" /LENGTH=301 /DNA_ID=CAMNT_0007289597 /DNA_START=108 /DNA_END=1009 /DNA_ORIENTATION=-